MFCNFIFLYGYDFLYKSGDEEGKLKRKSFIGAVISIFVMISLGILLSIFVIGEPIDGKQLYCTTSLNGQTLSLRVEPVESGVALRGWKFRKDNNVLHISARKVLVSPLFHEGTYETSIDLEPIESITVGGQTIWSYTD